MRGLLSAAISCLWLGAVMAEDFLPSNINLQDFHPFAPWIGYGEGGVIRKDPNSTSISGALEGWTANGESPNREKVHIFLEQWFMTKKNGKPPNGDHHLRRYPKRTPLIDRKWLFAGKMAWRVGDFPDRCWIPEEKRKPGDFFDYFSRTILKDDRDRARYALGFAVSSTNEALISSINEEDVKQGLEQEYAIENVTCRWSVFSLPKVRPACEDPGCISSKRHILQVTQGEACFSEAMDSAEGKIVTLTKSKRLSFGEWKKKILSWCNRSPQVRSRMALHSQNRAEKRSGLRNVLQSV